MTQHKNTKPIQGPKATWTRQPLNPAYGKYIYLFF